MKPSDLYTRAAASNARKMPLFTPQGEITDHYLEIIGRDSDEFQRASSKYQQTLAIIEAIKDPKERGEAARRAFASLRAALVVGWSLDAELTPEAAAELCFEAPSLAREIDQFAGNIANFLPRTAPDSSTGHAAKSS